MPKTDCPDCDAVISMDDPREGAAFKCPVCGEALEVISTDPFEVDYPLDDSDWDDDWDEEWEPDD